MTLYNCSYRVLTKNASGAVTSKTAMHEGSVEVYDDHIVLYKKSTAVRMAFGLIGALIQGKGKEGLTVTPMMVDSCDVTEKSRGKTKNYALQLSDDRVVEVEFFGKDLAPIDAEFRHALRL